MKTKATNPSRPTNLLFLVPVDLRIWMRPLELAQAARAAAETFYWVEADDDDDHPPFGGCACPLRKLTLLTYCYAIGTLADEWVMAEMVEDPTLRELTGGVVFTTDKLRLFRAHNAELLKLCLARVLEQAWQSNFGDHRVSRSFFAAEADHRVQLAWQEDRDVCVREQVHQQIEELPASEPPIVAGPSILRFAAACVVLGLLILANPVFAAEMLPPFTFEGRQVTNATVVEANPVDVLIRHDDLGFKRLKRQEMPAELEDRFPYNARDVEEYAKQQDAKARARREQARAEAYAALLRQEVEIQARIERSNDQVVAIQKEIKGWRKKPKASPGRDVALNQLIDQKINLERYIETLRKQLESVRKLQAQYR